MKKLFFTFIIFYSFTAIAQVDDKSTAMSLISKNWDNSRPELAQPLAVKVGAGNHALPKVVEKSRAVTVLYQLYPTEQMTHP
jgi:hypothetical protein